MSTEITAEAPNRDVVQQLMETISDLEKALRNANRLHQTIERNNRLFECLIASSHDGIALTRLDGTLIRIVRQIAGWSTADAAGRLIFDFIHPDDIPRVREAFRKLDLKQSNTVTNEVRLVARDGAAVWVETTMTDMLDNPAVHAIVHNYRDVSAYLAGEWAASERDAMDTATSVAVFSEDATGAILTWNRGAGRLLGYEACEIVGRAVDVLLSPAGIAEERRCREMVMDRGASIPRHRSVRIDRDTNELDVEVSLHPLMVRGRVEGVTQVLFLARSS